MKYNYTFLQSSNVFSFVKVTVFIVYLILRFTVAKFTNHVHRKHSKKSKIKTHV